MALSSLGRMLSESIHTDIVINASDGSIAAHRAVIASRLPLLRAVDKYDISDLKETCHESLLEDIDTMNVLERLQNASLYQLPKLKTSCMRYLVKFGKIYDIRDDFNAFVQ
ncbi:BTB/POZ domain-containing protein [Forsythia ovata]|uniref:BTB/POZ domain-containing protein n=1 Tax=Forsythia ovata TaxID=205694 RepID=A0ABD1USD3_9LAMI